MAWGRRYSQWRPYVSVAERQRKAKRKMDALRKKGTPVNPVLIEGRTIARTFWGKAWCDNLESYGDYSNRLPRGRTYVRNGSVVDLQVEKGCVKARVMGSSLYKVSIDIHSMAKKKWCALAEGCAGHIETVVELLAGRFGGGVMKRLAARRAFSPPRGRSLSTVLARTGRTCASTWPRRSTVWAPVWTMSLGCSSPSAAWTKPNSSCGQALGQS